jgi:hypothetical protein
MQRFSAGCKKSNFLSGKHGNREANLILFSRISSFGKLKGALTWFNSIMSCGKEAIKALTRE